ncbi:ankyrin, partial [Paxillus ammoniavirescens]
ITEKLERLPTSLHAMYSSMVSKINPNHLPYARAIMRWLLCSVRQLTLAEIAMVVGFVSSTGRPAFDEDRCFGNPRAVLDVCGGLVVMSQGAAFCNDTSHFLIHGTDGVTLAHLTVKEFLLEQESALHVNEPDTHSFIARSCLTYLLDQFQRRVPAGVESFPLHNYAVKNWMKHASSTRDIEDINSVMYELALEVLHPQHEAFRRWSSAWDTVADPWEDTYSTPLFVSAGWADVNAQWENSGTPLSSACSTGHMDIVKLLLEKGAHVNPQGEGSKTPLCSACYGGRFDIVELLLEKGADVNPHGKLFDAPLRSACSGGYVDIVKLLLQQGADVNAHGKNFSTPFGSACSRGDSAIIELLLQS